jgi:hypothetical protein
LQTSNASCFERHNSTSSRRRGQGFGLCAQRDSGDGLRNGADRQTARQRGEGGGYFL